MPLLLLHARGCVFCWCIEGGCSKVLETSVELEREGASWERKDPRQVRTWGPRSYKNGKLTSITVKLELFNSRLRFFDCAELDDSGSL